MRRYLSADGDVTVDDDDVTVDDDDVTVDDGDVTVVCKTRTRAPPDTTCINLVLDLDPVPGHVQTFINA